MLGASRCRGVCVCGVRAHARLGRAADGAWARGTPIHGGADGGDAGEEKDAGEAENGQRSMLPFRSSQNRGGAGGNNGGELVLRRWRWFTVTKRNKTKRMVREEQREEERKEKARRDVDVTWASRLPCTNEKLEA